MTTFAVFTDIDLDSIDSTALREALQRLDAAGIPVVPVTALTLAEALPIAEELGVRKAMIIESGGAIARWNGAAWDIEACSVSADEMLDIVAEIEDRSGAQLAVDSVLPGSAPRAFSEPFVIESGELDDVVSAAASLGFSVHRGNRLLHLFRQCDEGEAFTRVRRELGCDVAIALGDSPVDADFLARADIPIVLPRSNEEVDPELLARVPHARIAPAAGVHGWAAAVEECLDAAERRAG